MNNMGSPKGQNPEDISNMEVQDFNISFKNKCFCPKMFRDQENLAIYLYAKSCEKLTVPNLTLSNS